MECFTVPAPYVEVLCFADVCHITPVAPHVPSASSIAHQPQYVLNEIDFTHEFRLVHFVCCDGR